jgi:hypothetical protein
LFVSFCLYSWDPPNWDASHCICGLFGKLSRRKGALVWSHDVWTSGAKVIEYWMIYSLKIRLNHKWNFWKNWNVNLVLLETSWRPRFNGIYLVRFGFRMWKILILKWFMPHENSNKLQKTKFWKEKSVENVVTLEGLPFNSSMISIHIWLFKKSIHTLQNNVHMLNFHILYWVHTWANDTCHISLA